MPREREHESPAERQKAYRERKRNAEEAPSPANVTPRDDSAEPSVTIPERPQTLRGLIAAARAGTIELTEREEEQIRRHFGYASSEKRTLLQRDQAAEKMISGSREVQKVEADGTVTVTRYDPLDLPHEEAVGLGGLSLTAFPTQTPEDLKPSPEALAKLQG